MCCRSSASTSATEEERLKHASPIYYITRIVRYILGTQLAWSIFGLFSWAAASSFFNIISCCIGYRTLQTLQNKNSVNCNRAMTITCIIFSIMETIAFLTVGPLTVWQELIQDNLHCTTDSGNDGQVTCWSPMFTITFNPDSHNNYNDDDFSTNGSIVQEFPYLMFASIMTPVFAIGNLCFAILQLRIWTKFYSYPLLNYFPPMNPSIHPSIHPEASNTGNTFIYASNPYPSSTVPLLSPASSTYYPSMDPQYIQNEVTRQVQLILNHHTGREALSHGPYPSAPEKYPVPPHPTLYPNTHVPQSTYDYSSIENNQGIGTTVLSPASNNGYYSRPPYPPHAANSINSQSSDNEDPNPVRDRL